MTPFFRWCVTGTLLVLLIGQLTCLLRGDGRPSLAGPLPGEMFPRVVVRAVADGRTGVIDRMVRESGSCALVVLMSIHCSHCARMRYTWTEAYNSWSDSLTFDVPTYWVTYETPHEVSDWVGAFNLQGTSVVGVLRKPDRAWRKLGVIGTPQSYLVHRSGRVHSGHFGPSLPSTAFARDACNAPGFRTEG